MVFGLALEWARRCFRKVLDGNPCTIETQFLHKNVSHIVLFMKIEIKKFSSSFGEKNTRKQGWIACFFTLKVYCAYSNNEKNVKITETVAIAVTKHLAKFGIKKL